MHKVYATALLALSSFRLSAYADKLFTLSGVTFSSVAYGGPAGTLTGTFTTNDAISQVVTYNLVASPVSGEFLGFTYTPATATVAQSVLPSQYFQLDSAANIYELRLYFSNGLTASGGTLSSTASYEYEVPTGGLRYVSGSVTSGTAVTPEPSSLLLLGTGLLSMAGAVKRRLA